MTSEFTQTQVYGRAQGSIVPPLLMNPDPTRAVRLEITDRNEATTIKLESGQVFMLSDHDDRATLHIKVANTKLFPLLLGIPLTGNHFPALWSKGGRKLLGKMAKRKIVIKGL